MRGKAVLQTGLKAKEIEALRRVKRTPMALAMEIDCRDLTDRVHDCRGPSSGALGLGDTLALQHVADDWFADRIAQMGQGACDAIIAHDRFSWARRTTKASSFWAISVRC
jgi:hypothetical protein